MRRPVLESGCLSMLIFVDGCRGKLASYLVQSLVCLVMLLISQACAAQSRLPGTVELSPMPLDSTQAVPSLAVLGLNNSVITTGSLAFEGGYNPTDWSGVLQAVALNADGTNGKIVWDAGLILTDATTTPPGSRTIFTASADSTGGVTGVAFESETSFDAAETKGLMTPASTDATADTLATRVDYLRGVRTEELDGVMRPRRGLLGAIIHSQAVYVGNPTGQYLNNWPTTINGISVPAPEMAKGAQAYDQFVNAHADRPPMLYVGANDGMLHAFNAPIPHCESVDSNGNCTAYDAGAHAGKEQWAYVPRAVYARLGNLTSASAFQFEPTVDATPVMRDVFFSERSTPSWHTLLAGGLRLGGRGVYALDITDPVQVSETFPRRTVLWEFDADASPGTSLSGDTYNPADLGYTYGEPAIARLANGRWAVLAPSGYFPDCSAPDKPADCEDAVGTPPANYSALFVLDAQTGEVIRELKTSTAIAGVTSYGLSTPVLGDQNNDQIDDVAFAGDLVGNLWRFDLSAPKPADWKVTLAYRPAVPGAQPITVMPRLFPDPATQRFIVVFGTGKYLGAGDNTTAGMPIQAIYGIRDKRDSSGTPSTVTHDSLQAQTLTQTVVTDATDPNAGATLRRLTSHPLPLNAGGWYIDLDVMAGERVVTTPTALFASQSVLISTLTPSGNPHDLPQGSVMAVDAATGGPGTSIWSGGAGGAGYVGGLVNQPHSSGTLPVASMIGGGKLILPGLHLKNGLELPFSFGSPLWRRRSWSVLTPDP